MIGDEFSESAKAAQESAKAVQEIAKTTKAGIEATEKLGSFVSRIIAEPTDTVVGMLTDRLKYMRWERQQRLTQRAKEFIKDRNIIGALKVVPPKIALPIIENASLEENDELQDLWAYLIASAVDPNYEGQIRAAYINIIKQLEVNDVHILRLVYAYYKSRNEYDDADHSDEVTASTSNDIEPQYMPLNMEYIVNELGIGESAYKESIDNLIRVRCIASFIGHKSVWVPRKEQNFTSLSPSMSIVSRQGISAKFKTDMVRFSVAHIYDRVCITRLGVSFAKACMMVSKADEPKAR